MLQGCANFVGQCVPLGSMLQQGCISFRCVRKVNRCGLELVRGGERRGFIWLQVNILFYVRF